jgi:hypothetical protein
MINNNANDLKPGQIELPVAIPTNKANLPVIPEPQKDIDPMFRKPRPRITGTRVTYL